MADDILQQIQSFCDQHEVRRLEADEIRELLADGEDPEWIAGQAADDRPEIAAQLQALLEGLAPTVSPAEAEDDDEGIVLGTGPAEGVAEPESDAPPAAEGAPADAPADVDMADLQSQLAAMGGQLPPGVDARQLEQVLSSPRGQMLADFGAFCEEKGYDGADEEAMRVAHDEWLQTPREALEGKKPAEVLEGGRLIPEKVVTFRREQPKVGRNDPCPCGSGKKFKKCCGR